MNFFLRYPTNAMRFSGKFSYLNSDLVRARIANERLFNSPELPSYYTWKLFVILLNAVDEIFAVNFDRQQMCLPTTLCTNDFNFRDSVSENVDFSHPWVRPGENGWLNECPCVTYTFGGDIDGEIFVFVSLSHSLWDMIMSPVPTLTFDKESVTLSSEIALAIQMQRVLNGGKSTIWESKSQDRPFLLDCRFYGPNFAAACNKKLKTIVGFPNLKIAINDLFTSRHTDTRVSEFLPVIAIEVRTHYIIQLEGEE